MPTQDGLAPHVPEWPRWLLRSSLTLAAVLLFAQSITAGLFMTNLLAAFPVHREVATAATVAVLFSIVAAILCVRLRRDARWLIATTIGMVILVSLQAFAGYRSLTALHVPLGVITITLAIAFAAWTWTRAPQPVGAEA